MTGQKTQERRKVTNENYEVRKKDSTPWKGKGCPCEGNAPTTVLYTTKKPTILYQVLAWKYLPKKNTKWNPLDLDFIVNIELLISIKHFFFMLKI